MKNVLYVQLRFCPIRENYIQYLYITSDEQANNGYDYVHVKCIVYIMYCIPQS